MLHNFQSDVEDIENHLKSCKLNDSYKFNNSDFKELSVLIMDFYGTC